VHAFLHILLQNTTTVSGFSSQGSDSEEGVVLKVKWKV